MLQGAIQQQQHTGQGQAGETSSICCNRAVFGQGECAIRRVELQAVRKRKQSCSDVHRQLLLVTPAASRICLSLACKLLMLVTAMI
jgi:hypothetical protein